MSQMQQGAPVIEVKAKADIYSVLVVVAVILMAVAIGLVYNNLTSPVENGQGYGLEPSQIFEPTPESPSPTSASGP